MDWTVAIGVDTHAERHVAVALDRLGRPLGSLELAVDEAGFARLLSGKPLPRPRGGQRREQPRLLLAERRSAQRARLQAEGQLRGALVTLDPPLRARLGRLPASGLAREPLLRRRSELAALRRLGSRIAGLEQELAAIERELEQLTRELCPQLLAECGVGPLCCAQLLVSVAQAGRLRGEASFAALAGVSPIEASSGRRKRHRLNRGGDRQLNWALRMAALNRIRFDAETHAYYQRLLGRGKSKREAIRIVKRVLARRLYRTLMASA